MTDRSTDDEKIELYLDHVDAIEDVANAFDNAWNAYSDQWSEHLAETLDTDSNPVTWSSADGFPTINIERPDTEIEV